MKNVLGLKIIRKVVLFCVVILMINGIVTNGIVTKGMAAGTNVTNHSVIIGFKHPVGPADDVVISSHGGEAKKHFHLISVVAASVPENKIAEMKNDSRIAYVEDDKTYEAADVYEYNNSWGVGYIGSKFVHNQGITGKGVKVAVIDTGIDCTHPDLKDNCYSGYDFVSNDTNTFDDSYNSHGTHVSGIIAAERNGIGIVGVAPNSSVYAVKVLSGSGFGVESWIISGIQWAVDHNMTIISMSLEGPDSQGLHDAVDAAYNNSGLLLVAAAGNTNGGNVSYPAGYDSVIAVTAIDINGQNASFAPIDPKIELAAPGVNINSTVCLLENSNSTRCLQEGYGILSGTSMSAPYVTGVAALIYSTNLKDVNKDVRQIMDNTAFHLGIPGRNSIYGYGIVDAQNATLGIPTFGTPTPTPTPTPTATPTPTPTPTPVPTPTPIKGPTITHFSPTSPIVNIVGDSRTFSITADQTVNIAWYINGKHVQLNKNVKDASYTNKSASFGTWNVSAVATNNKGSDINTWVWSVVSKLTLTRTKGTPISDSKTVDLSQGSYSIIINNTNLSELAMMVYDNGKIRKDLSKTFSFNGWSDPNFPSSSNWTDPNVVISSLSVTKSKSNNISISLDVQKILKVVFVPYGDKGTTCNVTIKKVA